MAAPNMANVSSIIGKTAYLTPANTTENVILANAASSGKVLKINSIVAANLDGASGFGATVGVNTAADGSGTSYYVISAGVVPATTTMIVTDKSTSFYLEEGKSVVVKASSASKITFVVGYEEIN